MIKESERDVEKKIINNNNNTHNEHKQTQHHQKQQHNQSFNYNVNLQYDPQIPKAGNSTKLTVDITEQRTGDIIKEFETIHDKLMHIIIVGEDLSYFAHIHPSFEVDSGRFSIIHTFPEADKYKIWIDFKPKSGNQTLVAFHLAVTGDSIHKLIPIVNNKQYTKNIDGKYRVSLKIPKEIVANDDIDIAFSISDTIGNPITDLEPLMGAGGHTVIISSDIREFLHVHPSQEVDSTWKGGPEVSFKTSFPKPGLYKLWGQFQHQGRVITTDFVLEVV